MIKYGVKLPSGFNGSHIKAVETLMEMAVRTIEENKMYHGWTMKLERSPLGEWRFTIIPEDK